jgi:hypothetical protein
MADSDHRLIFQLTNVEANSLRSQNATLKEGRGRHRKYAPYAFTEPVQTIRQLMAPPIVKHKGRIGFQTPGEKEPKDSVSRQNERQRRSRTP